MNLSSGNKATTVQESPKSVQPTEAIGSTGNKAEALADSKNAEMATQEVGNATEVANGEPTEQKPKKAPKKVYTVVEEMPAFNGNLNQWLVENMKYPSEALKNKEQGRVIVQFIVSKEGEVMEPKIIRSVSPLLDKEALRVVSSMPKWKPGKANGKPVAVRYTLPIYFKLS